MYCAKVDLWHLTPWQTRREHVACRLASTGTCPRWFLRTRRQLKILTHIRLCAVQARDYVGALDWVTAVELTMSAQVLFFQSNPSNLD